MATSPPLAAPPDGTAGGIHVQGSYVGQAMAKHLMTSTR